MVGGSQNGTSGAAYGDDITGYYVIIAYGKILVLAYSAV